jgi:hypothetical protein
MTNLPPDPRSSRLGFDELVGIVVAFAVIGTILAVTLRQKDKPFAIESLVPSLTTSPASPDATITATPTPGTADPLQTQAPTLIERGTPLPEPTATAIAPATVITQKPSPTPSITPRRVTPSTPVVVAPPVRKPEAPAKTVRFSDVPQDLWARPYIEALTQRGIIAGYTDGTFRPDEPVTRAAFAAQLNKAFDETTSAGTPQNSIDYKDIAPDFWASSGIQGATQKGFVRGYPGNVFRPQQEISKLQALLALNSGLKLAVPPTPERVLQTYQDAAKIPPYATNAVAAVTQAGLVVNHPNAQQLNPDILITRAEAAALIHQALAKAGKVKAIPSQYVVKPQ